MTASPEVSGYLAESQLTSAARGSAGARLDLATALAVTPHGRVANPMFFSGFVERPDILAAGLLAVADVAGSRYADAGLARRLANLDPVVTAGGDRLRFESFSACNSVYARFDVLRPGLGSSEVGFGTTNVDINPPLRTALARIDSNAPLHLTVGSDELRASVPDQTHVERKVNLPDRWVRGLAEVPALLHDMAPAAALDGINVTRFLGSLPRVAPPGPIVHVLPRPTGWTTALQPLTGTFPLPGISRLRGADRVARHVVRLAVHESGNGTTAWVFTLPGSRLTLVLSPDPYRGFSGEGTLLTLLAQPHAVAIGPQLLEHLRWSSLVDPRELIDHTGLSDEAVSAGLAWLSANGRLGYDLTDRAWFHRELPVDAVKIQRRNPRLASARAIVAKGGVVRAAAGTWQVLGGDDRPYTVTDDLACTCTWYREHQNGRGPCKHVLATVIAKLNKQTPTNRASDSNGKSS